MKEIERRELDPEDLDKEGGLAEELFLTSLSALAGLTIFRLASRPNKTMNMVSVTGVNQTIIYSILGVTFFICVFLFFRKTLPWFRKK